VSTSSNSLLGGIRRSACSSSGIKPNTTVKISVVLEVDMSKKHGKHKRHYTFPEPQHVHRSTAERMAHESHMAAHPDCTYGYEPHFVPPSLQQIGFFLCDVPSDLRNHARCRWPFDHDHPDHYFEIINFEQLFRELDRWRQAKAPGKKTDDYTHHLILREVMELEKEPTDRWEMADVLFSLMAHVWNQDVTIPEFLHSCQEKLAVLWTRDYSAVDEHGVNRHT
jgi:hypothetical protein